MLVKTDASEYNCSADRRWCIKAGMTDAEIRESWLAYYQKWRDDRESAQIIRQLCALIIERAKHSIILGRVENQIMYLYHDIGIPKSEFEKIRRSQSVVLDLNASSRTAVQKFRW